MPLRAQTTDVALGIEALARRDVPAAEAAFRRGTASPNSLIHASAWQWLGHVAWKFRGDTLAASRDIQRALAAASDSSQVLLELARLRGAEHRYHDAVRTAHDAMQRSADAERRGIAARTLVSLAVDGAFAERRRLLRDTADARMVAEARDTLRARVERFPGRTLDALALIDAAAMLADSAAIRRGIASYFALADAGLSRAVDSIVHAPTIVGALARGRLYESLSLYVNAANVDLVPVEVSDALNYAVFLHDLRAASETVNRSIVRGTERRGDMNRAINTHGRTLWQRLHWNGRAPAFIPGDLFRELDRRFGTVITIERTQGADELYVAHRLGSYRLDGARIVVLDGMVSSGFDDWLLDGNGGRAGWVANGAVFERRTAFTETPFRSLVALTDPQTIPGEMFRIGRDSVGDIARAAQDSLGFFPGVAARIFRDGARKLLDSLGPGPAFTRAMFENLTRTTIQLHESRHLADARAHPGEPAADDEFRAKLDEVTGAALPRLSLTAILSPNIGDPSPHGQANRRIMMGLNRWIRRHGTAIAGYRASVPALLQLPLLTDAQLRAAFASMKTP